MKMPGNMQAMMQQAQKMQQKMQEEIALIRVEASAGGGMVTVKMDGHKNVIGVKIDPEVAGDVEMLQDLVMAACNEAAKKVDEETQKRWAACWAAWACRRDCSSLTACPISPRRLQRLIDEFRRLPGIGQKSAQRLAFHVLRIAARRCRAAGAGAARRQRQPGHLRRVQQHQRRRAVPVLPRSASRPHSDLRGRRTAQHPADRNHAHVSKASITCCTARFLRCAASARSS